MAYPSQSDARLLEDILKRKEFYEYKGDETYNYRDTGIEEQFSGEFLKTKAHQLIVSNFSSLDSNIMRLYLMHSTGTGKCLARGTELRLYNGATKCVESLMVGDLLMGDDGSARKVLSLARGQDTMCNIRVKAAPEYNFSCNMEHILTLRCMHSPAHSKDDLMDISVSDYIYSDDQFKSTHSLALAGHEMTKGRVEHSAYDIGLIIGGYIRYNDKLSDMAMANIKPLDYAEITKLVMPYVHNSLEVRNEFLAGIIAICGVVTMNATALWILPSVPESFVSIIVGLARSIGLLAFGDSTNCFRGTRFKIINLYGLAHPPSIQFSIEYAGFGDYFGMTLDGNGRFLLKSGIITHNTIAAATIADKYSRAYRQIYESMTSQAHITRRIASEFDRLTPSIFVFGFAGTKTAFLQYLLKYPEFGFITNAERDELMKRQQMAEVGTSDDAQHYRTQLLAYQRRIINKRMGGFYHFFGYDEFVNQLFSGTTKVIDLELQAQTAFNARKEGEEVPTLEDLLLSAIADGKIRVNTELVSRFKYSLIIADEVHNTYNTNFKNNRGVALQYILDNVPSVRFLAMSATPIRNSPTEIVELINYLVPRTDRVSKRDLFIGHKTIVSGGLKRIAELLAGRISFLQDINPKQFPTREIKGTQYKLTKHIPPFAKGEALPYLKFVQCPMSELHQRTLTQYTIDREKSITKDGGKEDEDALDVSLFELPPDTELNYRTIPADGQCLFDMVFPVPSADKKSIDGAFRTRDTYLQLSSAPQQWRNKVGIDIQKDGSSNMITGTFLERKNIDEYSSKYATMLDKLDAILAATGGNMEKGGKIMIYHEQVHMSGVLFIKNLLASNGYIGEYEEPTSTTKCWLCGVARGKHTGHRFVPARFAVAHSAIDKFALSTMIARYVGNENLHGTVCGILIGSRVVRESYDFKAVQHLFVMMLPTNIPTLLQVMGRCIRTNSHIALPADQRKVNVSIFVNVVNEKFKPIDDVSPEMYRYIDKLGAYLTVQTILRELSAHAIDADINRSTNMPPDLKEQYMRAPNKALLEGFYFEPAYIIPKLSVAQINTTTFNAYGYADEEVGIILSILKRLFMTRAVWNYDDLWKSTLRPPFGMEMNPALFSQCNFNIALQRLVMSNMQQHQAVGQRIGHIVDRIFDPNDRFIYADIKGVGDYKKYTIISRNKYFIRVPIESHQYHDEPIIDADIYNYDIQQDKAIHIVLGDYLASRTDESEFDAMLVKLVSARPIDVIGHWSRDMQERLIEEAIVQASAKTKATERTPEILHALVKLLRTFGSLDVIIYGSEVLRYSNVAKLYSAKLPTPTSPIGYMNATSIKLLAPEVLASKADIAWISVSKVSLNRQIRYREGGTHVGILDAGNGHGQMRFKLRHSRSRHDEPQADGRLIERGMVCTTRSKEELASLCKELHIKTSDKVMSMCDAIYEAIFAKEIDERQADSNKKYMYGWW